VTEKLRRRVILFLVALLPALVLAALCWWVTKTELTDIAIAAARSTVTETERYLGRVANPMADLQPLQGHSCDSATITALDKTAATALVVRDIALYDAQSRLYCSSRGPRNIDITTLEDRRPLAVTGILLADQPVSPMPALLVDRRFPDGSGVIATIDLALFREMAPPFILAPDGWLTLNVEDGTTVRTAGLSDPQDEASDVQYTAISSEYGLSAEVKVAPQHQRTRFLARLPLFELIALPLAILSVWSVRQAMRARVSMARSLRTALAENQLEVHYQPVLDLQDDARCIGAEALLRWRHPDQGWIRPDLFIPVAEETGLIIPVTRWLMRRIRDDFEGQSLPADFHIAINLCSTHLADETIVTDIAEIYRRSTVQPSNLILEITERSPIGDAAAVVIRRLKEIVPAIAVDDFGTGHSGLSYLQKYRFDYLKIDQSFVRSIGTDAVTLTVIDAIIKLAHDLGIRMVAEGIETAAQRDYLTGHGVHFGQGWLYAKALPLTDFLSYLAEHGQSVVIEGKVGSMAATAELG
jgi:sensor c-di-GMP phosphodiesterase-like protein